MTKKDQMYLLFPITKSIKVVTIRDRMNRKSKLRNDDETVALCKQMGIPYYEIIGGTLNYIFQTFPTGEKVLCAIAVEDTTNISNVQPYAMIESRLFGGNKFKRITKSSRVPTFNPRVWDPHALEFRKIQRAFEKAWGFKSSTYAAISGKKWLRITTTGVTECDTLQELLTFQASLFD